MVRVFFPQGGNTNIVANTNFPPQDSSISGGGPDQDFPALEAIYPQQGDISYNHYKFYYIPQNTINSPKTDYPITIIDTLGFAVFKDPEGHDVRFFLEDGVTEPDFYIVQADQNTGFFKAVVKFPTLDNGSFVQMCVGKSSFTDFTNPAATWPSQYISVYDMDKIVSPDVVVDSAGSNDGDAEFDVVQATDSLFGNFLNFNATQTNGRIDLGNPSDFPDGLNPRTMSMWIKPADFSANILTIMAYGTNTSDASMLLGKSNATDAIYGSQNTLRNVDDLFPTPNIFYKLVYTYDGITAKLFLNGNLEDSFTDTFNLVRNDAHIGTDLNLINNWRGGIFDVRIQDIDQSIDEETILLDFLAESDQLFEESPLLQAFSDNIFEATSSELITPTNEGSAFVDWQFRFNINVDPTKVSDTQLDFPVMISSTIPDLIGKSAFADGRDIRVVGQGDIPIPYELVSFDNDTGELYLFYKADIDDVTGGEVTIYIGNSAVGDNSDGPAVWSDYLAVYHMQEVPTVSGVVKDSTGNFDAAFSNDSNRLPSQVIGHRIPFALKFEETTVTQFITLPVALTIQVGTTDKLIDFATFNRQGASGFNNGFIATQVNSNIATGGFVWGIGSRDNTDNFRCRLNGSLETNKKLILGAWNIGGLTYDGAFHKVYFNGIEVASDTGTGNVNITNGDKATIGASLFNDDGQFDGFIQEVRIGQLPFDSTFILTDFNNRENPSTFYVIGDIIQNN